MPIARHFLLLNKFGDHITKLSGVESRLLSHHTNIQNIAPLTLSDICGHLSCGAHNLNINMSNSQRPIKDLLQKVVASLEMKLREEEKAWGKNKGGPLTKEEDKLDQVPPAPGRYKLITV